MFYAHHYGFRTGHCTECAALEIIDRVTSQVDIKYRDIPLNISIDLSKAFDSLYHIIVLNTLNYYGVIGTPLRDLTSYIYTDRNQFVQIENTKSSILHLKTGIHPWPTLSITLPNITNSRDQIIAEQLINTELNYGCA